MAPQQNSTLIDENLASCPSLLNIPEDINRYSPILPPKNKQDFDRNNNNNHKNNYQQHQNVNYNTKCELAEKEQRNYCKTKHYRSGHSRRSRSISLNGVNSTVEQGQKEITVWIGGEPRYVSGVTNKTTCNDIIKALIDDEISNGNYEYCRRLKDGTASRDYSDYVITEFWSGIERSYDGNMPILPVWKAWSRVHTEIRLSLKHHKVLQYPASAIKSNTTLSSIRNYICKILSLGKTKKRNSKTKIPNKSVKSKGDEKEKLLKSNDVMLVLSPDVKFNQNILNAPHSKNIRTKTANTNIKQTIEYKETSDKIKQINKEKLYKLSETRSSVRKRRSVRKHKHKQISRDSNGEPNHFLRRRKDTCIRGSVRNKLAQKSLEMNELYEREYALTKKLTNKSKIYKLHNELYTECDRNLDISVGQIQQSLEDCAKEIIQTEQELLEVKNEIKNDISIINSLKRLTLDTDLSMCDMPIDMEHVVKPKLEDMKPNTPATTEKATNCEQMLFVDNIYEFCDKNASMLV